jgi:sigma-E factor negative regulatory protein RseC
MITEAAVVTRCDHGKVEVRLERASACGNCELSQGCGTGALGRLLGNRSRPLVIPTEHKLEPGDRLLLGLSEAALVKASLTVYGLPLLAMVIAGLLAALFGWPDIWVASTSVAGFVLGYKLASHFTKKLEADHLSPYIVDIRVNPCP